MICLEAAPAEHAGRIADGFRRLKPS